MKYLVLPVLLIVFFAGCSSNHMIINYSPSSTMVVKGEVQIGDFKYLPPEIFNVKENQIRNTAIGSILFDKNINQYFKDALFNESRLVGISIESDKNILSGQIDDFLIDDLGANVDWFIKVKYDLNVNKKSCFSKVKIINKNTSKRINFYIAFNEIIKLNIEELFKDEDFKKCIK